MRERLTPWNWDLLEKPPIVQLPKNFPAFYGTRRFITVITRVLHWSLSWARSIQSTPTHPISLKTNFSIIHPPIPWSSYRSISILIPLLPIPSTCPAHHIFLDSISLIKRSEEYKLWSSSLCSFLQPPVTSSLFGPNILPSTLFAIILSLYSSRNVRDQISYPYRTISKLYTKIHDWSQWR
jgi:hypothetical protein